MGPGGGVVDIMCWIVPGIEQVTERDLVPCFGQCPRMLRSSYRGALTGSACQQARLLETEDRTGSAPKAWGHHLAKCAPRHGVSAGPKARIYFGSVSGLGLVMGFLEKAHGLVGLYGLL